MERPILNQPLKTIKWLFWKKHLDDQVVSGMSITHYCYKHGLCSGTFNLWRRRLLTENPILSGDGVVLIDSNDKTEVISTEVSPSARFVPLALNTSHDASQSCDSGSPTLIRLHVEGMVLEFFENIEPGHFQRVLNIIRGGQ